MLKVLVLVGGFGALGAIARFSISEFVYRTMGRGFPFGTLLVNAVGCLLLGMIAEVCLNSSAIPDSWRVGLTAGFMGSLTTFSTFGYETFLHFEAGSLGVAIANVLISVIIGLVAVWVGVWLARGLFG